VKRGKEEKKMNKLFEREEGIFSIKTIEESTNDKNVLYGQISEGLSISPIYSKLCKLLFDEVGRSV
jgi:uncharacterized protein (UPF0218 family)